MSDQDPHAEAYHVLGALRFQQDDARHALEQQIAHLAQRGSELEQQLQEAERLNDGDTVERIEGEIEDLHRAFALARDELDRHQPEQTPGAQEDDQPQEADDGDDVDSGHPEREGGAESGVERGDGQRELADRPADEPGGEGAEAPGGPGDQDDEGDARVQG